MANMTPVSSAQVVEWLTNPSNEDGAIWVLSKVRKSQPTLWQKAQDDRASRLHFKERARSPRIQWRLQLPVTKESVYTQSLTSTDESEDQKTALLEDDRPSKGSSFRKGSTMTFSGSLSRRPFERRGTTPFRKSALLGSNTCELFEGPGVQCKTVDDRIPLLMFNDSICLAQEEQGVVQIVVLRVGDLSKRSEVRWFTQDGSAKAGQTYIAASGTLIFEQGMSSLTVEVALIPNEVWDTMLEFKVVLNQEGLVNARLDRYMNEVRVRVFNDDPFPTNRYREELQEGRAHDVPTLVMVRAYISLHCRDRDIWIRSVKGIILDQLHNLNFFVGLFMQVFLIDYVLNLTHRKEYLFMQSRTYTLFFLVGLKLIPNLMLHFLDFRLVKYSSLVGVCRAATQKCILRQYFYCLDSCRCDLGLTGLLMAINNDADTVAQDVYHTAFHVYLHVGKLVAISAFQVSAPFVFGTEFKFFPLCVMFLFPVVMGCFLAFRQGVTNRLLTDSRDKQHTFCQHVDQIVANFKMITTFTKQDLVEDDLAIKVSSRNQAALGASLCVFNNSYFANWLALVVICAYMVIGGLSVLQNVTSVGYFVTTMSMFQQMGAIWNVFFQDLVQIQAAIPALIRVANFLNMPTNLEDRLEARRRGMAFQGGEDIDEHPIVLSGFREYLTSTPSQDDEILLQQGQVIALTSPREGGKGTLLRLLGGFLFPAADSNVCIHIPSHLRVLCLGSLPLFFLGTLANNLSFGMKEDDPDRNVKRMVSICKKIGLSRHVIDLVLDAETSEHWEQILSESCCHLLNLARALMATPDALCLEKPTLKLDENCCDKVLEVLREFVANKGLECSIPARCRRPRTIIYTTERMKAIECADICIYVHPSGQVQKLAKHTFTLDMMTRVEPESERDDQSDSTS